MHFYISKSEIAKLETGSKFKYYVCVSYTLIIYYSDIYFGSEYITPFFFPLEI